MQHTQDTDQRTAEMLDAAPWVKIVMRRIRAQQMAEHLNSAMRSEDDAPPAPPSPSPTL